jgi:18S rRNA (guanine1575-N7)-methyltransferase
MCSDPSADIPSFILDVGCGSGLSGEILTEEGHIWVGMDIAPSMLGQSQNGNANGKESL